MFKLNIHSLKTKIILALMSLVSMSVIGVVSFVQQEMKNTYRAEQHRNAQYLLEAISLNVENGHKYLLYHQKFTTMSRKNELKQVVNMALTILHGYNNLVLLGKLNEDEAKKLAIIELRRIRYKDGTGYIWINDTGTPYPRMIMHPTIPALEGKVLDSDEFNCAMGRDRNLFSAFVDITSRQREGYVDYLWPKPAPDGLTARQPKLSFVKRFVPWSWVLGSGLYMDDIEEDINRRLKVVIENLNEIFTKIKIADTGYPYIFNGEGELILHPSYSGQEIAELINPASGNRMLDDIINASKSADGKIEYIWDKPSDKGNFRYRKIAFVTYFEPLDWYIGSSFYMEEVARPIIELCHKAILFSIVLLLLAFLAALYLAHHVTKPLGDIAMAFSQGAGGDFSMRLEVEKTDEFYRLATYFNEFMEEISSSRRQLRISEKRFRILFEKSADPRLTVEEGIITDCNQAFVRLLSNGNNLDAIGQPFSSLFTKAGSCSAMSPTKFREIIEMARERGLHRFSWIFTKDDGQTLPVEVEISVIDSGDRQILHTLLQDVSEQKKKEQQLLQAQKMETVGNLAGGLAHDFNNVLNGITGSVSLLQLKMDKGVLTDELLKSYIDTISKASFRAASVVQQLLSLSKRQKLVLAPVDLNLSLEHVVKIAKNSFDKSVIVRPGYFQEPAMIQGDPGQIEQALLNCCINGAHAMTVMRPNWEEWGGDLLVDIKYVDNPLYPDLQKMPYWRVSVQDKGVGMDKETLNQVFDPFFTTKEQNKGTGLGLAMTFSIIKQHRGCIDVYSEPAMGTSFHLYLPVDVGDKKGKNLYRRKKQFVDYRGEGLILVVDDEPVVREMARDILESFGHRVTTAGDGMEGVVLFREDHMAIKAVLLDMAMPGMSGRETYLEMRKIKPDVKVLLSSGFRHDQRVQDILDLGVQNFVQKPYTAEMLVESLISLLGGHCFYLSIILFYLVRQLPYNFQYCC